MKKLFYSKKGTCNAAWCLLLPRKEDLCIYFTRRGSAVIHVHIFPRKKCTLFDALFDLHLTYLFIDLFLRSMLCFNQAAVLFSCDFIPKFCILQTKIRRFEYRIYSHFFLSFIVAFGDSTRRAIKLIQHMMPMPISAISHAVPRFLVAPKKMISVTIRRIAFVAVFLVFSLEFLSTKAAFVSLYKVKDSNVVKAKKKTETAINGAPNPGNTELIALMVY